MCVYGTCQLWALKCCLLAPLSLESISVGLCLTGSHFMISQMTLFSYIMWSPFDWLLLHWSLDWVSLCENPLEGVFQITIALGYHGHGLWCFSKPEVLGALLSGTDLKRWDAWYEVWTFHLGISSRFVSSLLTVGHSAGGGVCGENGSHPSCMLPRDPLLVC